MDAYDRAYAASLRPMTSGQRADLAVCWLLDAAAGKVVPFGDDPDRAILGSRAWDNLFEMGDGFIVGPLFDHAVATRRDVADAALHPRCRGILHLRLEQFARACLAGTGPGQLALL